MDIELLKSFLEINRTRHFGKAADNLCITQSAISARIRQLEDFVGSPLFTRARNNIQLTPAGQKLQKYAENIITTWSRAKQEIVLHDENQVALVVAGIPSLWDIVLQEWLHNIYRNFSDLTLYTEIHGQDALLRKLLDGTLDLAFMFESPQVSKLETREVYRTPLLMVSTTSGLDVHKAMQTDYIYVDWGTSFANTHAKALADITAPRLHFGLGRMAKSFLLEIGGTAYLAQSMIKDELEKQELFLVENAPVIDRSAYAVFAGDNEKIDLIRNTLEFFSRMD